MRIKFILLLILTLVKITVTAQDTLRNALEYKVKKAGTQTNDKQKILKVSGLFQGEYQIGEEAATLKVGSENENPDKSFNRIGIRRGFVKLTYEKERVQTVFQIDITEKGIRLKDAYLNIKDPWIEAISLRAGVFYRPFGFEIDYSASLQESAERSTIFQTLFPEERDLGAMIIVQAPKSSPWHIVKLEAGLFAGNGIKPEIDNKKDFIGHLSVEKNISNITLSGGVSYYNGGVYQGTKNVYTMLDDFFVIDSLETNMGKFAKRQYIGFDAQFAIKTALGLTQIRGEYIFGQQPSTASGSKSPNAASLPTADTYIRNTSGGYIIVIHDIVKTPFAIVGKYESYDPNTKISKNEAGQKGTNKTDLYQNTIGFGALWNVNSDMRLLAYYEINTNEKTSNIVGWDREINDNVFTLRLQYKF